jgi:anti-sigma factor RsiW
MNENPPETDIDDEIIVKVSDYLDGALSPTDKADVESKLASDPAWKATHDEMVEARNLISGMQKAKAPDTFVEDVTATIHKRSAGRFFARKTLGDRVPFGVLLVIALIALGVVGYLMWSSPTGSLNIQTPKDPPEYKPLDLAPP